ncbi:MAG: alpha/beta hydrolase [Myxococcales bacterium]|nr:alpha/beta hydrolase [Myxococcales bacterium]
MSLLTREDLVGSLFFPRADTSDPPVDARDLMVEVEGASIHVRLHGAPTAPMLLFFHGNGETVSDWDDFAPRFTPSVQFAVCDYRGYGQSTGTPTMQRLFDDAVAVFDAVESLSPLAPLVMGRSLGSAAAWHLAQTRLASVSGLIIDSGFSDVDAFARRRGVQPSSLTAMERSALDPIPKARLVDVPTLLLHGRDDTLIPVRDAERLGEACPTATMELIAGRGHNDVMLDPAWRKAVQSFLALRAPAPLLALTLRQAPIPRAGFRVVVDIAGRTTFHDAPTLAEAKAYAADVLLEGDAPDRTLALVFDRRGHRITR